MIIRATVFNVRSGTPASAASEAYVIDPVEGTREKIPK